jgi:hypothetical protein
MIVEMGHANPCNVSHDPCRSYSAVILPAAERCPIGLFTGPQLRHERFALRLQAEFPRGGSLDPSRASGGTAQPVKAPDVLSRAVVFTDARGRPRAER